MNDKDVTIANRILLASVSALVSSVFWSYILDFINVDEIIGPNPSILIGLIVISVIASDRIYVKLKIINFIDEDYTSEELSHFVGWKTPLDNEKNFRTLVDVLSNKCVSYWPHIPGWGETRLTIDPEKSLLDEGLIAPEIVCFCDIPRGSLGIHTEKYGRFGVGIDKYYLASYGCRPIMYVPWSKQDILTVYGKKLLQDIEGIYRCSLGCYEQKTTPRKIGNVPEEDELLSTLKSCFQKDFLAFIKPYDVSLSETDRENYYMEREWRRLGNVVFDHSSLKKIYVAKGYKERLKDILPEYSDIEIDEI
ncbi:abortive infection system antitoxin AbiGi family protein [Sulfuriflexus sp.]|uniref:abortive infection system antitoxin AbiGi family protein n=1 Tax=Sulfuriflexus sp. TaxID=2015443 RepID=UPI0028CD65E6|nr:abortive infection system antitoxin AbiGi family protein [Sulfuriflexus sp.]MDT8405036.1 abortive infection system antitoxin AbiGi family protein [Sulfuriflexus sp.]